MLSVLRGNISIEWEGIYQPLETGGSPAVHHARTGEPCGLQIHFVTRHISDLLFLA